MYSLTKERALEIQELHVRYYAGRFPGGEAALRARMAALTNLTGLRSGVFYDYDKINAHIPRADVIYRLSAGQLFAAEEGRR